MPHLLLELPRLDACHADVAPAVAQAVMNLSMEERGAAPQEPAPAGRGGGVNAGGAAGRFLTGDLSFFGVGSKNAGFFMGRWARLR